MNDLSIGPRLSIAFAAMLLITLGVAFSGYRGMDRVATVTQEMLAGDAEAARLADDARALSLDMRRSEKDFLLNIGAAEKQAQYHREWTKTVEEYRTAFDGLGKLANETEKGQIAQLKRDLDVYVAGFLKVEEQVRSGALTTAQDGNAALGGLKKAARNLAAMTDAIAENRHEMMRAQRDVIGGAVESSRSAMLVILLAGVALGVVVSVAITRSITGPVGTAVAAAERIAKGDLSEVVETRSGDEVEEMSSQAESLQQLMAFFAVSEQVLARQRFAGVHRAPALGQPQVHAGATAHGPARSAKAALPQKTNGSHAEGGGFKKF